MYADPAGIFLSENLISQKKNAFLADFAAGLSKIIKQNLSGGCLEGGPVPLRLLLRSRRLSSNNPPEAEAFMPRKALYNGLGRHSLMWQANPCEAEGWLVGMECLPRGPIVKSAVE